MNIAEKQSICHKRKNKLLARQTPSEKKFALILDSLGIRYMAQKGFIAGNNFCIVDFYLPEFKTCIEIDGGYHYIDKQVVRDKNRDYYLNKQRKFGVIHIDNNSIKDILYINFLEILDNSKNNRSIYRF